MMNYPHFSDYDRAVKQAADHFNVLSHLRPVLDEQGELVCCKGRRSVVFKMHDEQNGKEVAVKCFLEEQEGRAESYRLITQELSGVQSDYLVPVRYLEQELTVTTEEGEEETYPVVVMDWVEGVQLHQYVEDHLFKKSALQMLAYRFSFLASWLMEQPFAHADVRAENILVRPDGSVVLVDYDAMYVPAMKGQKPRELSEDESFMCEFAHVKKRFDERMDDYALVSILLLLKALSIRSLLWKERDYERSRLASSDSLLLSLINNDLFAASDLFEKLAGMFRDAELVRLCGLLFMAQADGDLAMIPSGYIQLELPRELPLEEMTKVTDEDWDEAVADEYGVIYSPDGLRLLQGSKRLVKYTVRKGTRIICNNAFDSCCNLWSLDLPSGLVAIGDAAFSCCRSLQSLDLPAGLKSIGYNAFSYCRSLQSLDLPSGLTSIGDAAFSECHSLQSMTLPSSLTSIGASMFELCRALKSVTLSFGLTSIGPAMFSGCHSLTSVTLPSSLISIHRSAFEDCRLLKSLDLPAGLTSIGDAAFSGCRSLQSMTLPSSLTSIGKGAFARCKQLLLCSKSHHFKMVDNMFLISDDKRLLFFRKKVHTVCVPRGVKTIDDAVFADHCSVKSVILPSRLKSIGDAAFSGCRSLKSLDLPAGLTSIGSSVFHNCHSLRYLSIPAKALSHFKEILPSEYHSLLKVQSKPQSLRNDVDADDALEAQT